MALKSRTPSCVQMEALGLFANQCWTKSEASCKKCRGSTHEKKYYFCI